mmetsp:Transcript_44769/g.52473  ORF Transcript_44769/g.52473 Transcript_44769/m.52473 type:complete len:89 (+) Transcript_44769:122-388(+)
MRPEPKIINGIDETIKNSIPPPLIGYFSVRLTQYHRNQHLESIDAISVFNNSRKASFADLSGIIIYVQACFSTKRKGKCFTPRAISIF